MPKDLSPRCEVEGFLAVTSLFGHDLCEYCADTFRGRGEFVSEQHVINFITNQKRLRKQLVGEPE